MTSRRSLAPLFTLPTWAVHLMRGHKKPITKTQDRMRLAVDLAATNVEEGTGGPFGAAIFERRSGRLIAIGVNLVESTHCSQAHAEMVAIANAQRAVRTFNLDAPNLPEHELVTSCEPCAMCYGAIPWSGIRHVLCGARGSDAEAIGFDEGAKPRNWIAELKKRGISVVRDLCRNESVAVLQHYKDTGGTIYGTIRTR